MRSPAEMAADEVRQFLLHLVEERKVSRETLRQVRSALRFLYAVTLNRPVEILWLPSPRRQRPLPVVLSGTEVSALLDVIRSPKYRGILMTMYAGGLRISEACRLRPGDIDSKRGVLHVRDGKGGVDRSTVLSDRLLSYLRGYWRQARPTGEWLFPGRTAAGHAGVESVREVFRKAVAAVGITKALTPHNLRHSFATHLMECGVDVMVIKALLGHRSLSATQVYTHVSTEHIARTRSPLDVLGTPAGAVLG
jgi:site-specific recombinase XerD